MIQMFHSVDITTSYKFNNYLSLSKTSINNNTEFQVLKLFGYLPQNLSQGETDCRTFSRIAKNTENTDPPAH